MYIQCNQLKENLNTKIEMVHISMGNVICLNFDYLINL